jgi:hypothetical protein
MFIHTDPFNEGRIGDLKKRNSARDSFFYVTAGLKVEIKRDADR